MGTSSAQFINNLLFIVLILMFIRTFRQAKSLGNGKGYMNAYTKILAGDLDAEENLDKYIESEKQQYLLSQAYLLKAYLNIEGEKDAKEYLDKVELRPIFFNNAGRLDKKKSKNNIAFFLWVNLFIAKCLKNNRLDLIDYLNKSFEEIDNELSLFLEYRLYKGIFKGIKNENDEDYAILRQLVDGEYPSLEYEKRYIGLYKREASLFLVYFNEALEEYWENDLHAFVDTTVGKKMSQDLNLYEKYHIETVKEAIPSDGEEEEK